MSNPTPEQQREYRRSLGGFRLHLYRSMVNRCKNLPNYKDRKVLLTKEEFFEIVDNSKYIELHNAWANDDYSWALTPSVDRIDNDGDYTKENIQIITLEENTAKDKVKSHCKRGHALIDTNVYFYSGTRHCRQCILDKQKVKRQLAQVEAEAYERGQKDKYEDSRKQLINMLAMQDASKPITEEHITTARFAIEEDNKRRLVMGQKQAIADAYEKAAKVALDWEPDDEFYENLSHDDEPVEHAGGKIAQKIRDLKND